MLECHHLTGADSFLVKVAVASVSHLEDMIERFGRLGTPTAAIVHSSRVAAHHRPADGRPRCPRRPARPGVPRLIGAGHGGVRLLQMLLDPITVQGSIVKEQASRVAAHRRRRRRFCVATSSRHGAEVQADGWLSRVNSPW